MFVRYEIMSKKNTYELIGVIMFLIGIILFFSNVRVSGFRYFYFGKAGLLLLLIGIDFVLMLVKPNKIWTIGMIILCILLVVSIILNLRIYLVGMSFFKYLGIAILTFGGIGLFLKSKISDD